MLMTREQTRIMHYLSDNLGSGGSILSASEEIGNIYKSTYYPNIYNAIIKLEKAGIIFITKEGKNRLISLNIMNPKAIYYISEAENLRAMEINLPDEMSNGLLDLALDSGAISICALKYETHIKINRIELLLITKSHNKDSWLINNMLKLELLHNTKIDPIILTPDELFSMLDSGDLNNIKDLISDKHILYNSEGFWGTIRMYKINYTYKNLKRFPDKLEKSELAYNYSRFGYSLYEDIKPGKRISLEDTILLMAKSDEIRVKYGAFILIKKNIEKINKPYLYYLFKRHELLYSLNGMISTLEEILDKEKGLQISALKELIPYKQKEAYDKKLIRKYILQYG